MKNSLITDRSCTGIFSSMPDNNESINGIEDGQPLVFIFHRVNIQSRLFFIVAEKGIDPAPDRIAGQETVIRPDSPQPVVDDGVRGLRGVNGMVESPVHDYDQEAFFLCKRRVSCPERPVFLPAKRIEEFPVERVVPSFELA